MSKWVRKEKREKRPTLAFVKALVFLANKSIQSFNQCQAEAFVISTKLLTDCETSSFQPESQKPRHKKGLRGIIGVANYHLKPSVYLDVYLRSLTWRYLFAGPF
jgi:hypothetical protein